jgi:hypothetical protein
MNTRRMHGFVQKQEGSFCSYEVCFLGLSATIQILTSISDEDKFKLIFEPTAKSGFRFLEFRIIFSGQEIQHAGRFPDSRIF